MKGVQVTLISDWCMEVCDVKASQIKQHRQKSLRIERHCCHFCCTLCDYENNHFNKKEKGKDACQK